MRYSHSVFVISQWWRWNRFVFHSSSWWRRGWNVTVLHNNRWRPVIKPWFVTKRPLIVTVLPLSRTNFQTIQMTLPLIAIVLL